MAMALKLDGSETPSSVGTPVWSSTNEGWGMFGARAQSCSNSGLVSSKAAAVPARVANILLWPSFAAADCSAPRYGCCFATCR